MFIEKSAGKNQSISKKHGSFRMVFQLVWKTIFEQTCDFYVIIFFIFAGYNQSLQRKENFILFCISIMLLM